MKRTFYLLTVLVYAIFLSISSGCSKNQAVSGLGDKDQRMLVYTSFYTMYDFAEKIGGDRIKLQNLVPAGTEPHDWEPSPKMIAGIEKADVLIYNGAGMEAWVEDMLDSMKNKSFIVVETSKDIKLLEGYHEEHDKGHDDESDIKNGDHEHEDSRYDPHVWLDPMNAKKQMEAIKNAFVTADPDNAEYYETNYEENAKKLDELNEEFWDGLSGFTKRDIVVAHKAFGYLCGAYGLNQVAIEGLNSESEPTPARMAEIIRFAREKDIKVIFFEELISPKVANTIAKEIGARTDILNPLEGLKQEDIASGKEYFSVMRDNLEALKKALKQ